MKNILVPEELWTRIINRLFSIGSHYSSCCSYQTRGHDCNCGLKQIRLDIEKMDEEKNP